MDIEFKKQLGKIANTIRALSMDAVQKANSGHPGLPLGCAEIGAYLYGVLLRHNPKNPHWINRDRFVLSAGHGSMFLYACLHLAGFNLSLEEIKRFRQLHSKTPGHPEYRMTEGVEATTGPLGQGVANAVGQALGLQILQEKFNTKEDPIFDSKVYCLAGDGCIMEGVSSEASSLAGHLCLNNLVLIYDSNHITLDGPLSDSCSEETKMRYLSYGWDVYEVDGYDLDKIDELLKRLEEKQKKPTLVIAHTIIGKGSPHKAGSHKAHGSPLGPEEVIATKKALGIPEEEFYVPQAVIQYFQTKLQQDKKREEEWIERFNRWAKVNPSLFQEFQKMKKREIPQDMEGVLRKIEMKSPLAGRSASQAVLEVIGDLLPFIYGGSADLSCSDLTLMKKYPLIAAHQFTGRNIKYGVREFAMGAIATGLYETEMIVPYVGTFLTFSDYMRNAIRLAAMGKIHVVYQFTHDSIFLGEDGPTHQPVEHLAALRAIPGLHVIRPADNMEVKMAWLAALKYEGPTALILSRQNLSDLGVTAISYAQGMGRGAYIVKKEKSPPHYTLFATGSELSLALDVAVALEKQGKSVRVVSMPCWEIFQKQDEDYKHSVVGGNIGKRVSIEAATTFGWHKWIGMDGIAIGMESFGESAPQSDLASEFGFTVDSILDRLLT